MGTCAAFAHDVLNCAAAHDQSVSYERAMASPWHRFGAHNRDLIAFCGLNQCFQARFKFWRLHVIGVATERRVTPSRIE